MKKFRPDKNALLTMRIIISAITMALILVVRLYIPITVIVGIIAAALGTVCIFLIFVYLPLYFSSVCYDLTDEMITRHGGAFMKSHKSVRLSKIQYTTVITTPFSRYTSMNFVILFVYGGQLRMLFLNLDEAMEILKITGEVKGKNNASRTPSAYSPLFHAKLMAADFPFASRRFGNALRPCRNLLMDKGRMDGYSRAWNNPAVRLHSLVFFPDNSNRQHDNSYTGLLYKSKDRYSAEKYKLRVLRATVLSRPL